MKNKLNDYCTGDYIYQIDADEMISEYVIQNLHQILELNPKVDLIFDFSMHRYLLQKDDWPSVKLG